MTDRHKYMPVLGAGSWGTALAVLLANNGQSPVLWGRNSAHMSQIGLARENARYLPACRLPANLIIEHDLQRAVELAEIVLVAVPSHGFTDTVQRVAKACTHLRGLVWATKGLQPGTARLLHEVAQEILGDEVDLAVLSGPTFAGEIARGLPAAVTIASPSDRFIAELVERFHNPRFRVYSSHDHIGVQVAGAVKNVLAIAAGIADGLGFGANTRSALITRGLAELMRLGVAMGGQRETFMGLAGLGDLLLTCTDDQSRNRRAGLIIGQGGSVADAEQGVGQVIEGIGTTDEVKRAAAKVGVEMPITEQVYRVLHEALPAQDAVNALLSRSAGWSEL